MIYFNDKEFEDFDSFDNYEDFKDYFNQTDLLKEVDDLEAFYYYCRNFETPKQLDEDNLKHLIEDFDNCYRGYYESEEDYCEEMVESCYGGVEPEFIENYIDYSLMARDWFDYGDLIYDNGYVFDKC